MYVNVISLFFAICIHTGNKIKIQFKWLMYFSVLLSKNKTVLIIIVMSRRPEVLFIFISRERRGDMKKSLFQSCWCIYKIKTIILQLFSRNDPIWRIQGSCFVVKMLLNPFIWLIKSERNTFLKFSYFQTS